MNNYTVYFDGYSSPLLHRRAGYCVVIYNGPDVIRETVVALDPAETNNIAEAEGLINALQQLWDMKIWTREINTKTCEIKYDKAIIYGDSKLVVDMYNGRVRLKNKGLIEINKRIKSLKLLMNQYVEVKWVPRALNKAGLLISERKI